MSAEIELNDFAVRCFRDTADFDYISARLSYRHRLIPQFLWQSLQSIEKYIKCILLLNRVSSKRIGHDLEKGLRKVNNHCPFNLQLSKPSETFISYINTFGEYRYLETSFSSKGYPIVNLDRTVWEIRRYCQVLDYEIDGSNGMKRNVLKQNIERIEQAVNQPIHKFRIIGGRLERIIANKRSAQREPLLWQNLYFSSRARKTAKLCPFFHSTHAPLDIRPHIIDEVQKFVYLPKDIIVYYKRISKDRLPT